MAKIKITDKIEKLEKPKEKRAGCIHKWRLYHPHKPEYYCIKCGLVE